MQILDYTNSQIISISNGKAKIQEGNFKLIHEIELDNFQTFIDETRTILKNQITDKNILYPYLEHELSQIQELLIRIKPHRAKRSLDFIGSAWKWIAGNPDHDDFEIIKNKMNNVLENNNKQVIINQLYNERINNVTNIVNELNNAIKNESKVIDQFVANIQYKIKIVKEELTNINFAIHWAKSGIINSLILSNSEVKVAIDMLNKENLPFATIEEALSFSNVKVMSNSSCLLYVVYVPLTKIETFEKLLIKLVRSNNVIIEIEYENVLKSENQIYGIINNCRTINFLSICDREKLENKGNSTCLPNLLNSRPSKCNKSNNQHIPTVEEISDGLLLVNQFNGNITIEGETRTIVGTFLIKYHNASININNRKFSSKTKPTLHVLPAILQPTPQEKQFNRILSLPMLNQIYINNTRNLESFQTEKSIHQYSTYGLLIILIIGLTILLLLKYKKKTLKLVNNINQQETEDPTTNNTYAEPQRIRIRVQD